MRKHIVLLVAAAVCTAIWLSPSKTSVSSSSGPQSNPLLPIVADIPAVMPELATTSFEAVKLANTCGTIGMQVRTGTPVSSWPSPCTPCVKAFQIASMDDFYAELKLTPLEERPGQLTPEEWNALTQEEWEHLANLNPSLVEARMVYDTAVQEWEAYTPACEAILAAQVAA